MKKTLLIAAASLFVIGQAFAQGQTPAPSGQKQEQKATQQQNKTDSRQEKASQQGKQKAAAPSKMRHASKKRGGHPMARHSRHHHRITAQSGSQGFQGQQQMQPFGFGGPRQTKLTCRKGQKPDGITCM